MRRSPPSRTSISSTCKDLFRLVAEVARPRLRSDSFLCFGPTPPITPKKRTDQRNRQLMGDSFRKSLAAMTYFFGGCAEIFGHFPCEFGVEVRVKDGKPTGLLLDSTESVYRSQSGLQWPPIL